MKVLAVLGICLVVAQALPRDQFSTEWDNYKKAHGKSYEGEEEARRMSIYAQNTLKINEHNNKYDQGHVSYRVNINQFTDMLESEVKEALNGYKGGIFKTGTPYVDDGEQAAATVDWRNKGVVTPVKNQGQCGSCWSFSTTGSLEGQHALKTGKLVSLSEQNLVDCSGKFGNAGCNGGLMDDAFNYIKSNGGIDTEKSYPYTAEDGSCHYNKKNSGATVAGHVDIPQGDEQALMNAVSKVGPIAVAIDASNWSFQMYSGGVYEEPNCSSYQLDHGVLVVGYGTENGKDYWLVKNSWGPQWGEAGYIKMTRNSNNQCGIASQASYPTV